jgi:hypothetical protein
MNKLFKAIGEIEPIIKDKKNPHFKNTYADINSLLQVVKPILHKHGLFLLQPIIQGNLVTQIWDSEGKEPLAESTLELTQGLSAQQKGSELTYFRRYTLVALLGLEAEDDDGNVASSQPPAQDKPWLNQTDKAGKQTTQWANVVAAITAGKVKNIADVTAHFKLNKEVQATLEGLLQGGVK